MKYNRTTTIDALSASGALDSTIATRLREEGILTLGDIVRRFKPVDKLLGFTSYNRKLFYEVVGVLSQTEGASFPVPEADAASLFHAEGSTFADIKARAYAAVSRGNNKAYAFIRKNYPNAEALHREVWNGTQQMLAIRREFTPDENIKIRKAFRRFIGKVTSEFENRGLAKGNFEYHLYNARALELDANMDELPYSLNFLQDFSPMATDYLEETYRQMCSENLSMRARKFAGDYLPHAKDLLRYAEKPLADYGAICKGRMMKKTLLEVFNFNKLFVKKFKAIARMSDADIAVQRAAEHFPFLKKKECRFVAEFRETCGHLPLFFMLLRRLLNSKQEADRVVCMTYGLRAGAASRSFSEVAEKMKFSRERVRQVIQRHTMLLSNELAAMGDPESAYAAFRSRLIVGEADPECARIKEEEGIDLPWTAFAYLGAVVGNMSICRLNNATLLVANSVGQSLFAQISKQLQKSMAGVRRQDVEVAVDELLPAQFSGNRDTAEAFVRQLAVQFLGCSLGETGNVVLPRNRLDVGRLCEEILRENGSPMSLQELFDAFRQRCPEQAYDDASQLRSHLYNAAHIRPIGKTSSYSLDSWTHVNTSTIRGLLKEALQESDCPLHINKLLEYVRKFYPRATKPNLTTNMGLDPKHFVHFERAHFGLASKTYDERFRELSRRKP